MGIIHPRNRDYATRGVMLLLLWMMIGWFIMAPLGLGVGLILNFLTGETNFTTGSTLSGMASVIPLGIFGLWLYLKLN